MDGRHGHGVCRLHLLRDRVREQQTRTRAREVRPALAERPALGVSRVRSLVLMKHSTNTESAKPVHKRTFWWLGTVFLIVNASVIDVVAFSLAPLTLVAPFTGVTIVLTTLIAWSGVLFVKETVDNVDVAST